MLAAYAAPGRGYHDLEHLREVLDRVDELDADPTVPPFDVRVVRWAAFFHDAVYRVTANAAPISNEEASARWASKALRDLDPSRAERVAVLVRATARHEVDASDVEGAVLCDADLAILAAPANRYERYVDGVRREYAWLAASDFAAGRASVLTGLLQRARIFRTPGAQARWEAPARANIAAELLRLESGPLRR